MEAGSSRKRHAESANNVSDSSTSSISLTNIGNKSYIGGGLKDTQHGVRYQLHLLMLILWRACVQKYFEFCLTSELPEAGKFDDIVFVSKPESNSKWQSRLLQVKHTTNVGKVITSKDLFTEKDGDFSLPKYFKSFTKINESCSTKSNHSVLSGSEIKDVILITNAKYDGTDLKDCLEQVDEPDKLLGIPGNTELKVFKLKYDKVLQEDKSKFENVSDFKDLIKLLVDPNVKQIQKTHKVFMEYYYALMRDVFEKEKSNMRFSKKFVDGTDLPKEVIEFRKYFLIEKESNMELKEFNWKITDGLAKEFQPEENPTIVRPAEFAQQFHNILKYFEKFEKLVEIDEDNLAKVFQDSNGTNLTDRELETFIANIRNLGGHVLIRKFSEIRFSTSFIRSSDQEDEKEMTMPEYKKLKKTPNDFGNFRSELKKICDERKLVGFNSIDQYKFKIGFKEFRTCEEGALERKLPKPFSDDDLIDFFDKFKIIFNYPDQLDEILGNEIKEKHKSLDCTAFKSICESDLHSWLVERMAKFYTYEKAVSLFVKIETDILALELNGFNESYFANIHMKYQFKPIVLIQDFLQNESENCLKLQFEYFALGPTRVVQTILNLHKNDSIQAIRKYTRRYGFIFLTMKQLDSKRFFKKICEGKKTWNLLIIDCEKDEALSKIDEIYEDYKDYFIKMIFMMHTKGEMISSGFTDLTNESQANLYKNAKLIIDPEVGEFNFSEAIDEMDQKELIDAETLHKFIESKSVKIENKIRDTDPIVLQYYIERCLKRMKEKYSEDDFVQNPEPIVILSDMAGGGKSSLLSSLSRKLVQYNKRLWLFRIDLNEYTEFLDLKLKIPNSINTTDEIVQFLLQMLQRTIESTFERNLFKNCLLKPTTLKLAFFFDGFDEISPDYKEVVLELLGQLQESRDLRVFVTTRPSMVGCLERKLKVESFEICPLSNTEQIELLTKFYINKFKKPQFSLAFGRLTSFAEALIEKQRYDIKDWNTTFTSNPLQLRMMAEIFNKTCQLFLNCFHNNVKECFPDKLNIFDLYEKYVELKLEFHCIEKEHLNLCNLAIRDDQKELRSLIETKYQYLALCENFNSDQLTKLLSPEEIEKANSFVEEVRNGKERRGLVDRVVRNKPHFIHRTFAEYFVACFLGSSLINGKKIEFFECFIQYIGEQLTLSAVDMKNWLEENRIPETSLRKLKCAIFESSKDTNFLETVFQFECNTLIKFMCNCFSNDDFRYLGKNSLGFSELHKLLVYPCYKWNCYRLWFLFNSVKSLNFNYAQNFDVLNLLVKNGFDIDKLCFDLQLKLDVRFANGGKRTDLILILRHTNRKDYVDKKSYFHEDVIIEIDKKKLNFGQRLLMLIHSKNVNYDSRNCISLLHTSSIDMDSSTFDNWSKHKKPFSVSFDKSQICSSTIANFTSDFDFHIRTRQGLTLLHWTATNCRVEQLELDKDADEVSDEYFDEDSDKDSEHRDFPKFIVKVNVVEAAVAFKRIDLLEWMLKPKEHGGAGADVDKFREYIRDNKIVALRNKEFEFCQWLIDEEHLNVKSDKWEDMPLLHASFLHCDLEASIFLVRNRADLNALNKTGHNALEFAASIEKLEIRDWLIKYRPIFIQSGVNLPDNFETYRSKLKRFCDEYNKFVDLNSIDQYKFKIGFKELQTCEEGALERELPKPYSDGDLIDFFDKFKIIFNYPNRMDEILGNEIKEKRKSLDCTAFKSICESDLHRWLAERMTTFYTRETALFDGNDTEILSVKLNGFSGSYFANSPIEYQFKPVNRIKEFLAGTEKCIVLRFDCLELGRMRIVQTFQHLRELDTSEIHNYIRFCGFLFIRPNEGDYETFLKIERICKCERKWNLLLIECKRGETSKGVDKLFKFNKYFPKVIFITDKNGEKISSGFTDLTDESQANLYKNAKLIINPESGEFNFSEAIDEMDQKELIDAETLHTFIEGKSIKIENKIRDSALDYNQYDVPRTLEKKYKNYSENDILHKMENVVIISGVTGIGKSSLLSSLSRKLVQCIERVWLFRIDLNQYTEFLDQNSIDTLGGMVQFLTEMLRSTMKSTFEQNLFKYCLSGCSSKLKLTIFFDGFDEISPDNREEVLKLLVKLQKCLYLRLFVTTRPSMVECLKKNLKVYIYKLLPLSETDQVEFLTKFWINKYENQEFSRNIKKTERIKSFACELIEKQSDPSDGFETFLDNPMHLQMMAEVFDKTCQSFLNLKFNDLKECFPHKLNIFDLYEKYVELKLEFHCIEKEHLNLCNLAIRDDQKELRSLIETKYQYLALCEHFNSDQLTKLLSPEEIEKANSFVEEVRNGKERRGLVDRVVRNKPHFVHRIFAEYFVACFLGNSLINGKKIEFFECFIQYIGKERKFSPVDMKNLLEENTIPEEFLLKLKYAIFRCSTGTDFLSAVFQSECNTLIKFMCNCFPNDDSNDLRFLFKRSGHLLLNYAQNIDILKLLVKNGYDIDELHFPIHLKLKLKSVRTPDGGDLTDYIFQHYRKEEKSSFCFCEDVIFELNKKKFYFCQWLLKQIHSKNVNYDSGNRIPLLHATTFQKNEGLSAFLFLGKIETSKGLLSSTIADFASDFDFHIRTSHGFTMLHWTVTSSSGDQQKSSGSLEVSNYTDSFPVVRVTVVDAAAACNRIDLLEWMLKPKENGGAGADVDKFREYIRDNKIVALRNKEFEFCQWLIDEEHLNVKSDKWEDMPLLHASFLHCDLEASKLLVKNGADLTTKNKDGHNALEFAASVDKPEICEWLKTIPDDRCSADIHMEAEEAQGAGINVKDNEGRTPMDL